MLIVEKERDVGRFRVWSEESGFWVMRRSTWIAVQNFFRAQAIQRVDMHLKQMSEEMKDDPIVPARKAKLVN